jgi:hypothetical protein
MEKNEVGGASSSVGGEAYTVFGSKRHGDFETSIYIKVKVTL